jgi:hypothetical protein
MFLGIVRISPCGCTLPPDKGKGKANSGNKRKKNGEMEKVKFRNADGIGQLR